MRSYRTLTVVAAFILCVLASHASANTSSELDRLNIRLVGTAFFQGDAAALVEIGDSREQRFLDLHHTVGEFTVADIQSDRVIFEKDGERFELGFLRAREEGVKRVFKRGPIKLPPSIKSEPSTPSSSGRSGSFLINPMSEGRVVSGFGPRKDPWGGGTRYHGGIDIAAPHGTRIVAAGDGVVVGVGRKSRLGKYVQIQHSNGYQTVYGHMSRTVVKKGERVSQGETIGYEGSTGRSTGPHLHFEVRKDGKALDPARFVSSLKK